MIVSYIAIPGQSTKLSIRQSVFVAKSPNLLSTKCTTPTVQLYICALFCSAHALLLKIACVRYASIVCASIKDPKRSCDGH